MGSTKQTRLERNRQINRWQLCRPFLFYTVALCCLHVAILNSVAPSLPAAVALVAGGLLSWGLIEYVVHRWVLHRVPRAVGFNLPGNLTHLKHHENPLRLERLTVQLNESLPICLVYFLLAWAISGSWQSATYVFTGLIAGYFFYEYLDFQAHHGTSQSRLARYFRRHHLLHHHYDASVRYGVTSPLFDYLFGTFELEKKNRRATVQLRKGES